MRKKTTIERGIFKRKIHEALYNSEKIKKLLLGDIENKPARQVMTEFKKCVKSHLFVEDTVTDTDTYIFYDIVLPRLHTQIKDCKIIMYLICHRDMIDDGYTEEGYYGNRADILTQLVEDTMLDEDVVKYFGIGELTLDSMDIYNGTRFYGYIMTFSVPNFR